MHVSKSVYYGKKIFPPVISREDHILGLSHRSSRLFSGCSPLEEAWCANRILRTVGNSNIARGAIPDTIDRTTRLVSRFQAQKLYRYLQEAVIRAGGTRSCTIDQEFTSRFNPHTHFPRTHDVARGKNLGTMQAIEDVTDIDQAPAFYNFDEILLSSTSVSIWVKMSASAV